MQYSAYSATLAKEKGFNVEVNSLENSSGPEEKADIVVAWMLLEHLHYPVTGLKKILKFLHNDGYLVASIPFPSFSQKYVFKEYSYDLQLPTHLFHFSKKSLKNILNKSGWDLISIRYQPNAYTFLKSLRYYAIRKESNLLLNFSNFLIDSPKANKIRVIMGWVFKVTKQSGRVEFTAKKKI